MSAAAIIVIAAAVLEAAAAVWLLRSDAAGIRFGFLCGLQAERLQVSNYMPPGVRGKLRYLAGREQLRRARLSRVK